MTTHMSRKGYLDWDDLSRSTGIAPVCLGLLLALAVSGHALGTTPSFFSIDTESRLDRAEEQAVWMTPSSCSGTCFHGPVELTTGTEFIGSAQNRFNELPAGHPSSARPMRDDRSTPQRFDTRRVAERQSAAGSAHSLGSAQNPLGHFAMGAQATVEVAQATSSPQNHADGLVADEQISRQSGVGLNSAQAPFGKLATAYPATVRLVQSVNELEPIDANEERPAGSESVSEAQSLGSEPENTGLQFLRTQSVLLRPHQWQFDAGLSYTIAESDFPVAVLDGGGNVVGVTEGRIRQRLLLVPFEARYGLTQRIQLFASAPVGYSNTELAFGATDNYTDSGGIGDVSFGLTAQLIPGSACRSELIGTFGVTTPTGDASLSSTLLTPEAALGEGFWGFTGNLLWIKNYDPVVVFYGVGANFRLEEDFGNVQVDPGERFLYQLGLGFAVNQHVTLSGAFLGSYWVEDRWNDVRIPGGIREPLRFRVAATIGKSCRIVEPFAEIGMTNDAPTSRVGITWTF